MKGTTVVRGLHPHEWHVLRDVRLAALAADPEAFESTVDDEAELGEADWVARLDRRAVAFLDDNPVGIVGWAWSDQTSAELISMWVAESVRGTGVADALMEFVKDVVRAAGGTVTLAVRADNPRALRFYERTGFTVSGEEVGRRSGKRLLWMLCSE